MHHHSMPYYLSFHDHWGRQPLRIEPERRQAAVESDFERLIRTAENEGIKSACVIDSTCPGEFYAYFSRRIHISEALSEKGYKIAGIPERYLAVYRNGRHVLDVICSAEISTSCGDVVFNGLPEQGIPLRKKAQELANRAYTMFR